MSEGTAQRIEACVDAGASAILAAAVLVAAWKLGLPMLLAAGWGMLTFLICFWLLGSIQTERTEFSVREFVPGVFQPDPPDPLLDDVLANGGGASRVVRLFDPSAAPQAAPPDASEALYEALAQLRRSLR